MQSYNVYIDSAAWFCEGNAIDSSRIYRYIIENDHKYIDDPSNADFIIINSCGFIKDRENRTLNLFKRLNKQKKENANVILFGCLIKINPKLIDTLDCIKIDLNEGEKFDKIFYKKTKFDKVRPYCDETTKQQLFYNKNVIQQLRYPLFSLTKLLSHFSKKLRMNYNKIISSTTYNDKILVEICRGCTSNCNYCVIKKAKGKVKSRQIKDILSDIEKIYDPTKKLFLVADDCSCYGVDIKTNFFNLLKNITKKYPKLPLDIDTINPEWLERFPKDYISLFKESKIEFVTIPVQSGSNKVLNNMNRRYDIENVVKIVDKIKKVSPKTFIYSHFIIGYPGEKWRDYIKTMICALHFDFPIFLIYSEHKDSSNKNLLDKKSNLTISAREHISNFFLSFLICYKLLTHP